MPSFTPWASLAGGAIIGAAATVLFWSKGRSAGISGILGTVLHPPTGRGAWRWFFLGGLIAGGALCALIVPDAFPTVMPRSMIWIGAAGLLVGFGTRLGGGCTSGHGICGNARLSSRSIAATLTFIATGALAVAAFHWLGGAA